MVMWSGLSLAVNSITAAGNTAWFNSSEFDDYAIVLDFENDRYAMPELDENDDPILTRVEGKFPKRAVSFADAMAVTRYTIGPDDTPADYPTSPWYTYDAGTDTWSLLGGDGLGINVVRRERWLDNRFGMWVDPTIRFNRTPFSYSTTYPRTVALARGFSPGYRVSWVGDDDLTYTVIGHAEAPWSGTIAAQSTTANGLNWGVIPYIPDGYGNEDTIIGRASTPGSTFFGYVNMDVATGVYYPPTTAVETDTASAANGGGPGSAHVERSTEHVRVSSAIASIINRGDFYPRPGTFILETHMTMEPTVDAKRVILAGNHDAGLDGPAVMSFTRDGDTYRVTSGSFFGDLHLALPDVSHTTSLKKIGLAIEIDVARRLAISGVPTIAEDAGNTSWFSIPHFGCGVPSSYVVTQTMAEKGGTGAYYSLKWSPDVFSEAQLLAATEL